MPPNDNTRSILTEIAVSGMKFHFKVSFFSFVQTAKVLFISLFMLSVRQLMSGSASTSPAL